MRPDMDRVIVNIARHESDAKSLKTRLKLSIDHDWEDTDFVKSIPISHSRHLPSITKEMSDRLSPLYRFLFSRIGRPWSEVYSEIRQQVNRGTMRGYHLLDGHLFMHMIEQKVADVGGGALVGKSGSFHRDFYVHPETGIFCYNDSGHTKSYYRTVRFNHQVTKIRISELLEFRLVNNEWFEVRFVKHNPGDVKNKLWDSAHANWIVQTWGQAGSLLEEIFRKQLATKQLNVIAKILAAPRQFYQRTHRDYIKLYAVWSEMAAPWQKSRQKIIRTETYAVHPSLKKLLEKPRRQERSGKNNKRPHSRPRTNF